MRIVLVGPVPPLPGGIAQHTSLLAEALHGCGHQVHVLSWRAQYPARLYPGEQRVPGHEPMRGARFDLAWFDPASWWRAGRQARRADLFVFQWVTPVQAPFYRTMLASSRGTPTVAIVHNPMPHERRRFDEPLTRSVLRRVNGALVHSMAARADFASLFPSVPVRMVPLPPLVAVRHSELPPAPPFRLLFLGLVRSYKGLDVALEAVKLLRDRGANVRLTVAGEFWDPVERWRASVDRAGLDGIVDLLPGYVPDAGMSDLLASHHVLVAPYRTATQSGIVPIALAAGRPVVATRVGGLAEVVLEGTNGALARPGDAEEFAAAITRVIEALPRRAERAAAASPTWPDVAAAITSFA